MSTAFAGLGAAAAFVLIILIVSGLIQGGATGLATFIENYYWIIGVIILIMLIGIFVSIYNTMDEEAPKNNEKTSAPGKVAFSTMSCLAAAQNLIFLIYGLYRTLTSSASRESAFIMIIGVGGFILFYAIDTFLTISSIVFPMEWKTGASAKSILPFLTAVAGFILIALW